ncbi:MAG: aminotransferase class V-fold PLP-dependent enzyme, partial [Verrucomicrobia bacterium]|nr:aminotransferase class V-fold PLP-dependent enzyme [Verrucomicrobiota bacterium]
MNLPSSPHHTGWHFLQVPGPTNVPDRILRAIDHPVIDHRGPDFANLCRECLEGMKSVFQTQKGQVFIYPGSGTGAWEAAIVNTLSPGDRVLMFETGHFAVLWRKVAESFGLKIDFVESDWRHPIDTTVLRKKLEQDTSHQIKSVMCVHNETSTGVLSSIQAVRQIINEVEHPALLMVDTVSSLASMDYRHDEWAVDVTVCGSQKGLMLPPGLGFNAVSQKALESSQTAKLPRSFWSWQEMIEANKTGFFPYTPATNLLYGLREAIHMLIHEEGLTNVFARHARLAEATRRAVNAWGLQLVCADPDAYSNSSTAIFMPDGYDEVEFRRLVLDHYNLSLGAGLSKLKGKAFRIGHLGDLNDLMLCATLCGVEMGLAEFKVPTSGSGVAV